jgi:hypothetical protein
LTALLDAAKKYPSMGAMQSKAPPPALQYLHVTLFVSITPLHLNIDFVVTS